MRTSLAIALFTLLTLFIASCKQQSSSPQSQSTTPNLSGSCTIAKWTNLTSPLILKMSSEFGADYTNADLVGGLNPLEQMAKVWNDAVAPSVTLFQLPFTTASTTGASTIDGFHDNEMGIYKSHTWFPEVSSGALAITQFYGLVKNDPSLGTYVDLTHADIIFNYRDFGASLKMNATSLLDYDLPTILLHEMGHFLGECHEQRAVSIMNPYYSSTQRSLKTFDLNRIRALYLNNQVYAMSAIKAIPSTSALSAPTGSPVRGIVELSANGMCRHFINGKLTYEHEIPLSSISFPQGQRPIPWK
ncbi:MAG: matrixin family metalloprotease [Bacteriovorax sp.]